MLPWVEALYEMFSQQTQSAKEGRHEGKKQFSHEDFYTMLALGVMFLVGVTGNADAGSILIPVAEFTTDGGVDTAPGNFYKLFNGGYLSGTDAYPCLVAPVRIPNNATKINKVIVYLIDDNTSLGEPWFQLDAIDMATGTVENYTIGEVTTGTSTL